MKIQFLMAGSLSFRLSGFRQTCAPRVNLGGRLRAASMAGNLE